MKLLILEAKNAFINKTLSWENDTLILKFKNEKIIISPYQRYRSVWATMNSLHEGLVEAEGSQLRSKIFEPEWNKWIKLIEKNKEHSYGNWVYFPYSQRLVQYAPDKLHRLALVLSNSSLTLDPQKKMSYEKTQKIFKEVVPLFVGLSVGSNAAIATIMALQPYKIILSDLKSLKTSNLNRLPWAHLNSMLLSDLEQINEINPYGQRNKALAFTDYVNQINPYINTIVFPEGINDGNIGEVYSHKPTISIDVCDSPLQKLHLAKAARRNKIPHLRLTDAGHQVWVDFLPFDRYPDHPLSLDINDKELDKLEQKSQSSKKDFFNFAAALVGKGILDENEEFGMLINEKLPKMTASVPQLGATAMAAGGLIASIIANYSLGHTYPKRLKIDLRKLKIETWS